jgi:FkbM family methyltransferase
VNREPVPNEAKVLRRRRAVFDALNRPGLRPLLAAAGTAYLTAKRRELTLTRPHGDLWLSRYRSGVVVQPVIGGRSPEQLADKTHDEFLHRFVPKAGDTVIDVGAGTGDETLEFARLVGSDGLVVSVEAHPRTFRCLRLAVELNALSNVKVLNLAATDTSGIVEISDLDAYISNTIASRTHGAIAVPAMTLHDVAAELGLERVALLKMNIEGAERWAVPGMTSLVDRVDNVAIACHDFVAERTGDDSYRSLAEVARFLTSHGFSLFRRESDPRPWVRDTLYGERAP